MIYKATKGSKDYRLAVDITDLDTEIILESVDGLEAPGILTLGEGIKSETVHFTHIEGDILKGVTRGLGIVNGEIVNTGAYGWIKGNLLRRLICDYDYNILRSFILGELVAYEVVERDSAGRVIRYTTYRDAEHTKAQREEIYAYTDDMLKSVEIKTYGIDGVTVVVNTIETIERDIEGRYTGSSKVVLG